MLRGERRLLFVVPGVVIFKNLNNVRKIRLAKRLRRYLVIVPGGKAGESTG